MAKSDYRRQLIMLRGLEKGYSGHARLERRVMSGTLDIIVSAPAKDEALVAALVGPRGGSLSIMDLGPLKSDGRGQRGLLASFDPRNIAGMDLNDVALAVVSRMDGERAQPVLTGRIGNAKAVDFAQLRALIEKAYVNKQEIAGPESRLLPAETEPDEGGEPEGQTLATVSEMAEAPVGEKIKAQRSAPAPEEAAPPEEKSRAQAESAPRAGANAPAGAYLDVDMSRAWPDSVEALRLLFLTTPKYEPFARDGYVFVKAGMAEETGVDHCAVGVKAENGRITGVAYAIPMPYSAQPPAGLEDYTWIGDANTGWWFTEESILEADEQT